MLFRNLTRNSCPLVGYNLSNNYQIICQQRIIQRYFKHKTNVRTFLSDKERVRDFLTLLNTNEKRILYEELREHHEIAEAQTITIIGAQTPSNETENPPSIGQLRQLFLAQALPFIGFGFLDNLLMILAGDYIDLTLGLTLGISTMAAAGLGNALSDVAGVGSAYYVERLADKIGMRPPRLSLAQMQMTSTRWTTQIGRALGVAIGCVIGMFPLLFLPNRDDLVKEEKKK